MLYRAVLGVLKMKLAFFASDLDCSMSKMIVSIYMFVERVAGGVYWSNLVR